MKIADLIEELARFNSQQEMKIVIRSNGWSLWTRALLGNRIEMTEDETDLLVEYYAKKIENCGNHVEIELARMGSSPPKTEQH